MSDKALSQSRISTYAKCQRLYEFTYDWEVNVVDEQRRYIDRGNVLHSVIQNVCNCVGRGLNLEDSEIRQLAIDLINTYWDERMDRSEYYSDAEFEEDRLATVARIEAFFNNGPGFEYVRNSVATELYVTLERNGETYHGSIDNVVLDDGTLTIVDYKSSSIKPPFTKYNKKNRWIRDHLDDGYRPKRIKSAIQAALYLEAIKSDDEDNPDNPYNPEMDLEFVFYELQKSSGKTVTPRPDEITVEVEGNERKITDNYDDQKADVWELIEKSAAGIQAKDYEPDPFNEIYEDTCPDCEYRSACPEYLEKEMSHL